MIAVVTRFGPSPTGHLHLGSARTALFCYLFSKRHQGKFMLRFEDTDKQRSHTKYVSSIQKAMKWLGLEWDEEPIFQSRRTSLYANIIQRLLKQGDAYRCLRTPVELAEMREKQKKRGEKPKYDGYYRDKNIGSDAKNFVVRFKNPLGGTSSFHDSIRGSIEMDNEELDDLVIARADGSPTYNLCAVADDIEMGITHILRGEDHIVNSLRQLNIYKALNAETPQFAHLPIIINNEGRRLSKRDGAQDILDYKEAGILPAALCSYLARLGWSHGDQEIFRSEELISLFDIKNVHPSPASFDEKKLNWMNQYFIQHEKNEDLSESVREILKMRPSLTDKTRLEDIIAVHKEACSNLQQLADSISFYFVAPQTYEPKTYAKFIQRETLSYLKTLQRQLDECPEWSAEKIKEAMEMVMQTTKVRFPQLAMPFRLALCGTGSSPAIHKVAALLGKEETRARMMRLTQFIQRNPEKEESGLL